MSGGGAGPAPHLFGLDEVQRYLVVEEAELKAAKQVIDRLVRTLQPLVHPAKVYVGGSFKKGTCLRHDFDVDAVVFLNSFSQEALDLCKRKVKDALSGGQDMVEREGKQILKLKCSMPYAGRTHLPVDLSFTGPGEGQLENLRVDADSPDIHSKPLSFRAFHTQANDDKIIEQLNAFKDFHIRELVLLTKFWKNSLNDSKLTWFKSIHIELACLRAVQDTSAGQGFRMTFGRVLTLIAKGLDNSDLVRSLAIRETYHGLDDTTMHQAKKQARATLSKLGLQSNSAGDTFLFVKPSQIRFTQHKCSPKFSDRDGHGVSIGDTALQLIEGDVHKRDVPMIKVVEHEDGHIYSVDNRRLAVFRLLEIHACTRIVKVQVVATNELHRNEWVNKFSTKTDGRIITVSGPEAWTIGVTAEETTYPLDIKRQQKTKARYDLDDLEPDAEDPLLVEPSANPLKRKKHPVVGAVIVVPRDLKDQILREGYRCSRRRRVPCSHDLSEALRGYKRFYSQRPYAILEVVDLPDGIGADVYKAGYKINTPHLPAGCLEESRQ
ncbi:unnamed protein product [Prorocentrum cordatum]|uniref:Polymerase nucleotidyl transferase domain-containing protein n=1 Tax=Prorocentrum cordatum TaxID=2364126 RepID=A0ABN9RVZ4_9DINO|nr:unnamed protein product [Polarella glacialis]